MENLEGNCQNFNHNSKKIIQYCLNRKCNKQRKACEQCLKDFHQKHFKDCFSLNEIDCLLQNERSNLIKIQEKSDSQLKNKVDQILQRLSEQLLKIQTVKNRSLDSILMIIQIGLECLNGCYYEQLLAFCLKLKLNNQCQLISEVYKQGALDLKIILLLKQSNELFKKELYLESIKLYKIIIRLNYISEELLQNLSLALFLTNQNVEAEMLINNNFQVFQRNPELMMKIGEEISNKKQESNAINTIFTQYNFNKFQVYWASCLNNLKGHDLAISLAEKILKEDPLNQTTILIKGIKFIEFIDALLCQKKYGLLLEFIEETGKIKPELEQCLKYICLLKDYKYFSNYWNTQLNQADQFKFARYLLEEKGQTIKLQKAINNFDQLELTKGFQWQQKEALSLFQKAVNEQPDQQIGNMIIIPLCYQGKFQEALKHINQLLVISPNSRLFYVIKGQILVGLDRDEEGLECLKVAMYCGEWKVFFTKQYALGLMVCRQFQKAAEIASSLEDPNYFKIQIMDGQNLQINQKYHESVELYNQFCKTSRYNINTQLIIEENQNSFKQRNSHSQIQAQMNIKSEQSWFELQSEFLAGATTADIIVLQMNSVEMDDE